MKRPFIALVFAGLAAVATLDYAYVNDNDDSTGDVDPGDVTLTGVTAGNLLIGCAGTSTQQSSAPVFSSTGDSWSTAIALDWLNGLRSVFMAYELSANGGDTTLNVDIPGADTAVYNLIGIVEYSDSGGFDRFIDSDSAVSLDGDDTSIATPSIDGDTNGAMFVFCSGSQSPPTGTGTADQIVGGVALYNAVGDKRVTASSSTLEITWTGNGYGGIIGMSFAEAPAGGSSFVPGIINNPMRGGGVPDLLKSLLAHALYPFYRGPLLVQQKWWVRR